MSSHAYASGTQLEGLRPLELFVHRAHRNGQPVVILRGVQLGAEIVIEAEVYPTSSRSSNVLRRPYRFSSRDQVDRFVDQTLVALEYAGCTIG